MYLNPDASPQGGAEIFATKIFRVEEIGGALHMHRTTAALQVLPLKFFGARGKAIATLWQLMLECGMNVGVLTKRYFLARNSHSYSYRLPQSPKVKWFPARTKFNKELKWPRRGLRLSFRG